VNGSLFLQKRSRRHMARALEGYERLIAPTLPASARGHEEEFKALLRDTIKDLTSDGCDVIEATRRGEEINGYAIDVRDQIKARPDATEPATAVR
jgi:hypothetical protein